MERAREPLTPRQQALVTSARHVVDDVARQLGARYLGLVSHAELVSLGNVGLVLAARQYQEDKGVPFERYAYYRVMGEMLDGIRCEARTRREERTLHRAMARLLGATRDEFDVMQHDEQEARRQYEALVEELGAAMFLTLARAGAVEPADAELSAREQRARARRALAQVRAALPRSDDRLVELLYDDERALGDAAAEMGISYSTAYRRERHVLRRLGAQLRSLGVVEAPAPADEP